MFTTEAKTDNQDKLALAKIGLRVAARHLIAAKPEAALILAGVCGMAQNADLSTLANDAMGRYSDKLAADPILKEDIADILTLLGLRAKEIDHGKVTELIKLLCSIVTVG